VNVAECPAQAAGHAAQAPGHAARAAGHTARAAGLVQGCHVSSFFESDGSDINGR
jgi:hypothetical protein